MGRRRADAEAGLMGIQASDMVLDGRFYTFKYIPKSVSQDIDINPFIFCIRPSLTNPNNFVGLNLHHLPILMREKLITGMQKSKNFMNVPRMTFSEEELNHLAPGCKAAVREYSRKRVLDCYAVDNKDVPLYIYANGSPRVANQVRKLFDFLLKSGMYK